MQLAATTTISYGGRQSEHDAPEEGEWEDWAEVVAADLAEPTFQALVGEIDADQEVWAGE